FLDRVGNSVLVAEGNGRWVEYAGGYSDMVAQRGSGIDARTSATKPAQETGKKAAAAPQAARDAKAKRKLSFNEKHALETLPIRIDALQKDAARLKTTLADTNLYSRDPALFSKASEALAKAETDLAKAEEDWLALEILREEIEG